MTGAPRGLFDGGEFIAVRREAVATLGSWEAAGVWHRICWRSQRDGSWIATVAQIAEECVLSEHKTRQALKVIREAGWITANRAGHADRTLRWEPIWQEPNSRLGSGESTDYLTSKSPTTPCPKTVETSDALFDVAEPGPPAETDNGFDEWYALYPRKKDPGLARKAYATALKKTDRATLLAALKAQLPSMRAVSEKRFVKHPTSWLNAEGWSNEIEAVIYQYPQAPGGADDFHDPEFVPPPAPKMDMYG